MAKAGHKARAVCTPSHRHGEPGELKHGAVAAPIAVSGRGEEALLVQTKDSIRKPQNRRVDIVIP